MVTEIDAANRKVASLETQVQKLEIERIHQDQSITTVVYSVQWLCVASDWRLEKKYTTTLNADFTFLVNVYMFVGLKTANRNVAKLERKVNILEVEKREPKAGKSSVLWRLQSNTCLAPYFKSGALIPDPNCLENL